MIIFSTISINFVLWSSYYRVTLL